MTIEAGKNARSLFRIINLYSADKLAEESTKVMGAL